MRNSTSNNLIISSKTFFMRKIFTKLLIGFLFVLGNVGANAQQGLATYTPVRTTGNTYTSISGTGTSVSFWRNSLSTDDNLSSFLDIGFPFIYDGVQVCGVQVSTNGFINLLGNTGASGSGTGAYGYLNNDVFTTAGSSVRVIAPFYDDQQTAGNLGTLADLNASIKYQTTGTAPNRIFTIEWINMQDFSTTSTSSFNYQVKLFEGSNDIEFNYGTFNLSNSATVTTMSYSLGLNSSTLTGVSPFATTMLFTQQTANTATFSGTQQNILGGNVPANMPLAGSRIHFTYGGAAAVAMTGPYTIPGSFATFTAAINALNYNGVSGAVTINVTPGGTYTENAPIVQLGCQSFPITFQKSGAGANPIISASGGAATTDAGIRIWGGNNITFDGIDVTATASTLEYGYFVQQYTDRVGAQNNVIQNTAITLNRTSTTTIGILQSSTLGGPALIAAGANSNNIYRNLTIKNAYAGIQLNGAASGTYSGVAQTIFQDNNNQITSSACATYNIIGDPATPNDIGNGATATYGVFMANQTGFKVNNCKIQNLTSTGAVRVDGIVVTNTSAATFSGGTNSIYNNKIFTLRSTSTSTSVVSGIRANNNSNAGTVMRIYNNFIGD